MTKIIASFHPDWLTDTPIAEDLATHRASAGNHDEWSKYKQVGPLREVRTSWIKKQSVVPPYAVEPQGLRFQNTLNFIRDLQTGGATPIPSREWDIGRAYYCTIPPGCCIYPHADVHYPYFDFIERYQVFFDIPEGCREVQAGSQIAPHTLVAFSHKVEHSYYNEGPKDWEFMVFDLVHPKCEVIEINRVRQDS